jgi:multiple sugar transport system substrate-binding protein
MQRRPIALLLAILALAATGCGGGSEDEPAADGGALEVWIEENQPDRVAAMRANVADFTRRTGIKVDLVPLGDDEQLPRTAAAAKKGTLPDVMQISMAEAHRYAGQGILDTGAAQQTVEELGEDTFSARALSLLTMSGSVAAVPSDGWGQLLIYRKDLFDAAGLPTPETLADVQRAARRLGRPGRAGITLATAPDDGFTSETFEHVALAAGCQLVADTGEVNLDSPACRRAFEVYVDLARNASPGGVQDVDTTRDAYFAGRAAMIFWSPFLLDAMAGLRDDAVPSCRQCKADPAYLARNSGLVGPLRGGTGEAAAQYGNITTWGISAKGDVANARRFVRYMLSDGYLRWLALSPQGKYPVRAGDGADLERFVRGWEQLESGVERRAPLERFYRPASIASLGDGVRSFQRWGFEDGHAGLVGALGDDQPVVDALVKAIRGEITPRQAAQEASAAVAKLQGSIEQPSG